jgi:hypothetical protein
LLRGTSGWRRRGRRHKRRPSGLAEHATADANEAVRLRPKDHAGRRRGNIAARWTRHWRFNCRTRRRASAVSAAALRSRPTAGGGCYPVHAPPQAALLQGRLGRRREATSPSSLPRNRRAHQRYVGGGLRAKQGRLTSSCQAPNPRHLSLPLWQPRKSPGNRGFAGPFHPPLFISTHHAQGIPDQGRHAAPRCRLGRRVLLHHRRILPLHAC